MSQGTLTGTGERQVFRTSGPQVVWWLWAAFAAANLIDLAVQGRDHFAAEVAAFILLVTGVAYACAWRPRVVADDSGITLENPLRDQHVPWSAVGQVRLGRSLEIHCSPAGGATEGGADGGGGKGRVLYAWAIQSSRRVRTNADRRARRTDRDMASRSASYAKLPPEAREMKGKTAAELMTRQLAGQAEDRRARAGAGQPAGAQPSGRWAWWSIAAMLAPAVLLVIVVLV
ncbi:MAG: PH domain-containing protein [Nocardiopsaceae bacterium]|jgi:hypothetical protein|nr:PH domain-containing protein [Nocardiopsaceae bacterium]